MSSGEGQPQSEAMLNGAQQEATSRIFALDPAEGEAWWWFGVLATIKATKEQTGGQYTLVEILAPEGPGVLHVHHAEDEGFYILEGELTFYVGEETIKARPARSCSAPRTSPTPSRSIRGLRGCCSSSRPLAWRESSGRWVSRQKS